MKHETIKKGQITANINYLGAELCSLIKDGKEYVWDGNPAVWANHAPILFPVCGGLKNNKFIHGGKEYQLGKHGFAKFEKFKLYDKTKDYVSFVLSYNKRTLEQYPFKFDLFVNFYALDSGLRVEYKVVNKDEKNVYFAIGGHEGYALHDNIEDYSLIFSDAETLRTYEIEGGLLSGKSVIQKENVKEIKLNYDYFKIDAIILENVNSKTVTLRNDLSGDSITVSYDDFKHLLIWTKPSAKFICIEPWTAMPDLTSSNNVLTEKPDIIELKVNEIKTFTHYISIK